MNLKKQTGLVAASLLLLICANSWADTVSLPLTDDAFVAGNVSIYYQADTNFGADSNLWVHAYGPKQSLLRFDAASISGETVNNATLRLYLNDIERAGTISVHAITSSWNEASVTWNNRPPAEVAAAAILNVTTSDEGSVISIDVTNVVERWAAGSLPDAGLLLVTANHIRALFDAKEKSAGTSATLEVDFDSPGPPTFSGEAIVLDLSNPDNCDIDEPGYYVLDRTWWLTGALYQDPKINTSCVAVHIASGGVTLDLQGFDLVRSSGSLGDDAGAVLWVDTVDSVTLRNGGLDGILGAIQASVAGGRVTLDRIHADGAVGLANRSVTVTGGSFFNLAGDNSVGGNSRVTAATFNCTPFAAEASCLVVGGSSLVSNNYFRADSDAFGIVVIGDGTIVEGNVTSFIRISGNGNVVARNISRLGRTIEVNGAGNILDGNIGLSIVFGTPGNFYGNNRVALPGGFTGTVGNVDWGGNVTY